MLYVLTKVVDCEISHKMLRGHTKSFVFPRAFEDLELCWMVIVLTAQVKLTFCRDCLWFGSVKVIYVYP